MKITFYGGLADVIGREVALEGEVATVRDLRAMLARLHPHLAHDLEGPRLRACVSDAIVPDDFPLAGVEAVEFFPPLSGG